MNAYLNLETWNYWGGYASYILAAIALGILLFHYLTLLFTKDPKAKYDFINKNEINNLLYSAIVFLLAVGIYVNTLRVEGEAIWVAVLVFVTVMMGLIIGVIISNKHRIFLQ